MPMFGKWRDIALYTRIAKEYMRNYVGQNIVYYKLSLADLEIDIYGDAKNKMYLAPVRLVCIVGRNPQTTEDTEYGTSTNRAMDFHLLKDDLYPLQLVPEKGDIVMWNESYFEIDNIVEDKLIVGKDPDYSLQTGMENFGQSLSITCQGHLTHPNRLNIIETR